ncbi:DNA polymerase-1 [Bradyrhizobium sp. USDA 3397]
MSRAPFETGSDSLLVAFSAQAEIGCFRALSWPVPANIADQYAEFRVQTNGSRQNAGLLNALAFHNLPHMDASLKDFMREKILSGYWTHEEIPQILDYCEMDVDASAALLSATANSIDWPRALIRGAYCSAVAGMEYFGIPIDVDRLYQLRSQWPQVRMSLIAEVDANYGVYDGDVFKRDRFSRWLHHKGIPWPRLDSGLLDLSDEAFKLQEQAWPVIAPLRELRNTVREADLRGLHVGHDGRARTSLRPFSSVTGRNQPSTTRFPFGTAKWMRGFIAPSRDRDLAYIDFSSQEIAIAGGLSGDERLIAAYLDGDPYMAFARLAKLAPADATKYSHPHIRSICKVVVLGLNYGMGAESIALQAGITVAHARELVASHKRIYSVFWKWSDAMVETSLVVRRMKTVFGWERKLFGGERLTSIKNFPMQATGAEMMRIAAIAAIQAGIEVCAPVHDAFLIAAAPERLASEVETMRNIMTQAGMLVCGVPVRTEAKLIRYPNRYMEARGIEMWNRVMRLASIPEARFDGPATV